MNQSRTVSPFFVIILLLLLLLSGSKQAEAQAISEWKIGFSVDRTSLDLERGLFDGNNFVAPETGYSISVLPVFRINDDFSFITGLEYNYFNYSLPSIGFGDILLEEAGDPDVSYVSLPLLLNFYFPENLRSINLTGGFRVSRRVQSTDGRFLTTRGDSVTDRPNFISQNSNKFILSYTLGVGYRLPGRLQAIGIDLLYQQDLTPYYNVSSSIFVGFRVPTELNTWRRSLGLRLNYHF